LPLAAPALGEVLFQLDESIPPAADARSRLRSRGTDIASVRSALRAFARQGHLVGRATVEAAAVRPPSENEPQLLAFVGLAREKSSMSSTLEGRYQRGNSPSKASKDDASGKSA